MAGKLPHHIYHERSFHSPCFYACRVAQIFRILSTGRIQSRALESRTAPLKESRETRTFTASTGKTSSAIQLSGSISMSTSPVVGNHAKGVRQRIASPQHRLIDSGKSEARGLVYFLFFLAFYTVIIHL
jgi:hypothetical protein